MNRLILSARLLLAATAWTALTGFSQGTLCDRQCLVQFADQYVAALVAHDPARVPMAANARIVENLKPVRAREGLWSNATAGPGAYRIHVPDVVAQQIGYVAVMQANDRPVMVALRLKIDDGRITEAEHLVVARLRPDAVNLKVPRKAFSALVSAPYRDSRERLLASASSYYDALDFNNGSLAPFADDCVRFENGVQASRNKVPDDPSDFVAQINALGCAAQLDTQFFEYITRIDNRRVWIADEQTGVVFGLSQFRHAMTKKTFRTIGVPGYESRTLDFPAFDMPAVHLFKIWGGRIHEIETLGVPAPYNAASGWETGSQ